MFLFSRNDSAVIASTDNGQAERGMEEEVVEVVVVCRGHSAL